MVEPMMTMKEVTEWLRISEKTVQRWIKSGVPVVNIGSATRPDWRFERERILEWLDAGKPQRTDGEA